jgi:hypothetical protein
MALSYGYRRLQICSQKLHREHERLTSIGQLLEQP